MCSVIAGLSALLTLGSGYASYQAAQAQADAQAAAYEAQAQNQRNQAEADAYNARLEGKKQELIADKYAREGKELRDRRRIIAGQQKAQTGAAGIDFTGSALDILSAGRDAYAQDQMTLLSNQRNENFDSRVNQYNFNLSKLNNEVAARNSERNADYVRQQARQQGLATILGTATSMIGGIMGSAGGGVGNSGSSGSSMQMGSVSTSMGHGVTATFTPNSGYSFTRSAQSWGNTPRTYFGYYGNSGYKRGNFF